MNESIEQAKGLIAKANNIAVVLSPDFTLDSYLAATALAYALTKKGKKSALFSDNLKAPSFSFLATAMKLQNDLSNNEELIIKVDTKETKPGELRYEVKDDGLYVYLKSKQGLFSKSDVQVTGTDIQPDVIIVIGAKDYDQLGELYKNNSEVFAQAPLLVIDINPANEQFGLVNLVQVNFSSNCELVMVLLNSIDATITDSVLATYLLAGIISSTSGFTEYHTSPATMENAAKLMQAGADKQMIIKDFYKTKNLPTLQLWGRMLARVVDAGQGILYTTIQSSDFSKTNSNPDSLSDAFKDLVEMASEFKVIATLAEAPEGTRFLLAIKNTLDAQLIIKDLGIIDPVITALNKKYDYINITVQGMDMAGAIYKLRVLKI